MSVTTLEKVITGVYELTNRSDSGYVRKGQEHLPNPERLNCTKFLSLMLVSHWCPGKNRGYVKIQYVPSAPTIFVDDLYKDPKGEYYTVLDFNNHHQPQEWKRELGLTSLGYDEKRLKQEYAMAMNNKVIGFEFGILTLDKYDDDPILRKFLDYHEQNVDAPNKQYNKRKFSRLFMFKKRDEETKAGTKLEALDPLMEAMSFVNGLRTKKEKGYIYTEYNKNKIDSVLMCLDIKGIQQEDWNQKLLAINAAATMNAEAFLQMTTDMLDEGRMAVAKGIDLGILSIPKKEGSEVKMSGTDKKSPTATRTIFTCITQSHEDRIEETIAWLKCPKGINDWRDLTILIDQKR